MKLATLVDQLDSAVRIQSTMDDPQVKKEVKLESSSKDENSKDEKKRKNLCEIGKELVNFLIDRNLITLSTDVNFQERVVIIT